MKAVSIITILPSKLFQNFLTMKQLFSIPVFILLTTLAAAQVPAGFNFQGVARDAQGNPVQNKTIKVRLSLHDGSSNGTVQYREIRTVTTNTFGLFSLIVGGTGADATTGSFDAITWSAGNKFLQTEIDPTGGNNFTNVGTVQMLSVPYAIASSKAVDEKLSELTDANITNPAVGDQLQWDGTKWKNVKPAYAGIQTLAFNGAVGAIPGNSSLYVFAGPTTTVTITGTSQTLTGTATAPLGFGGGATPSSARIGICYQRIDISGQPVQNMGYTAQKLFPERRNYSASGTVTGLTPGTYKVGLGILNGSANTISDNDNVSGWIMLY